MWTGIYHKIAATILLTSIVVPPTVPDECTTLGRFGCYRKSLDVTRTHANQCPVDDFSTSCERECDGKPKVCYYTLHVEPYSTMGPACGECPRNKTDCFNPQCIAADGIEKNVLVFNRKIPGPSIQVCQGDKVVVDVVNSDAHRSTSVHWHGIRQVNTQYSDGVPMVTQCPINPGETYRYMFYASDCGTFFYHSHSGIQKIDGLNGPLVVRCKKSTEPNGKLYDYDLPEHVVVIQDWLLDNADKKVPGFTTGTQAGSLPDTYLINGKGVYAGSVNSPDVLIDLVLSGSQTPISEFFVKKGKRYRFRLIGSTCLACTVKLTIQGHRMKLIHTDGAGPVTPTDVDGATFNSGDRFDVIIEANQNVDSYWILLRGQGSCNDTMQLAVLRYTGSSSYPSSNLPLEKPNGVTLNPTNPAACTSTQKCVSELTALSPAPWYVVKSADTMYRFTFKFGFHFYGVPELFQNNTYCPYFIPAAPILVRAQINSITNKLASSPLLTQYHDIPAKAFCRTRCRKDQSNCICLNLYKVPLGTTVDIIVADTARSSVSGLTHPFHMHGTNFYVLQEGVFTNGLDQGIDDINKWLDTNPMVQKQFAPQKDTIGVPSGGYVVIRFFADNPGFWLFHCHFTLHLDLGMSAVLQVGELGDMTRPPPGFPTCGDFLPPI